MKTIQSINRINICISLIFSFLLFFSVPSIAQEKNPFNPIAANAELDLLKKQINTIDVKASFLNIARTQSLNILGDASVCSERSSIERDRLEIRFAPLKDIDANVSPAIFDQRNAIRNLLDEVTARQISCAGARDEATAIVELISTLQEELSEQYLSYRSKNLIEEMLGFPAQIKDSLSKYQNAQYLNLIAGLSTTNLLWLILLGGLMATGLDVVVRKKSKNLLMKEGPPSLLSRLLTQPLARHSSSLLIGLVVTLILFSTILDPSLDRMIIRIGLSIFLFGITSIIIDWATGDDSPAAEVKGLIPDHIKPLRFRLALLQISLIASFIVFGTNWLTIRLIDPDVTGRAAIIFLVSASLLYTHLYLGKIPGLENKYRIIRSIITLTLSISIIAVIIGYQNFSGYLIHGITRSSIALFLVWVMLWLITMSFEFLTKNDTPTAVTIRKNLGIKKEGSRTGLGFVQLITDLVIWLSLFVYLVYVWDASGTTVDRLFELIVLGGKVGNIQLVPAQLIGGMLIFTALLGLIGWLKRWIDRRWLQHIVIERGAREALVTLFGYVGFIIALLFGLTQAGVDLSGLAIVSGALALGIGFGMQEIAGNFISGLILLFERPIRTGDFVSVGKIEGFVRKISIRATEIETLDNQNVLVPNAELVSGRVTNWVLRDTQGRLRITIGVAYGSDVKKVQEILESIANEHSEVITDGRAPAPRALFMGFGDSSLDFELRCRINRIDRRFTVQSDINFELVAAFREAGINIPFPQRDLHIITHDNESSANKQPKKKAAEHQAALALPTDSITRSHHEEVELNTTSEELWRSLIDIELLKKWLIEEGEITPRIGGKYNLNLRNGDTIHGRIDALIAKRKMRFVEAPRADEEPLSSGPITTEFVINEDEDKVKLTVNVIGIPAIEEWEEDFNRSQSNWQLALKELKARYTNN